MIRRLLAGLLGLFGFCLLISVSLSNSNLKGLLTPAQIAQATQAAQADTQNVIVILRDQMSSMPPVRGALQGRADALSASQDTYIGQLQATRARKVTKFKTINAFATTVSKAEADQLLANPGVQAVVPDAIIRAKHLTRDQSTAAVGNVTPTPVSAGLCGTLEPEALQLTNAAFLNASTPQAQQLRDGNGKLVTGQGVKVAFIADGLDTTVSGFTRPDGSSVFIDYEDFSGDPAGTPTGGGEAFGDASSIAAQDNPNGSLLTFDISQFVASAHPLPSPCDIRIRGIAPGASLVGLKVFSALGFGTTSSFVQAIEYAVVVDDVDVINESFGGAPFFDAENDPISLANGAAVAAGATVVVSSGDAGTAGTLGSPSTDPNVISAGATTQFRFYAQTGDGAQALATGVVSNNISAFSSAGYAQLAPRTVDVVAPGDSSWALCSTDPSLYGECTTFNSNPTTPIESFGGTSEAAPLTSGEAALVIQAYRSTHHNANPTPALIKEIIMSTATNLGAPSDEQGAGLINALAAVQAALSVADSHGTPTRQGSELLITPASLPVVAAPNASETQSFSITNTGSTKQKMSVLLQGLGAPIAGKTYNLTLAPGSDPTFLNVTGAPRSYITQTFHVPAAAQHLDAAIAWQNPIGGQTIAYISLLDPSGRQAAYSEPQGLGSAYGHVDIVAPAAGTWTAVIFTRPSGSTAYAGTVQFTWAAQSYVNAGTVSPATISLAPGATTSVAAHFTMPAQPGDTSLALHFVPAAGGTAVTSIPVTLRTTIPLNNKGGSFTGTLTGGNARPGAGPTQTFEFTVPNGPSNMSLNLSVSDPGYLLEGLLVDPHGMQLSVQANVDANGNLQGALQQFRASPEPGVWHFVLLQNFYSSGNQTSLSFNAHIGFNTAQYSASQVPNSVSYKISASGGGITVPISVTNNGALTELFFADARLATPALQNLEVFPCSSGTLPGDCNDTILPTEVSKVTFVAIAPVPITMDASNSAGFGPVGYTGSPDLFASYVGTFSGAYTVAASLNVPEVPPGFWFIIPSLVGPYGSSGAPTTPVEAFASVSMKPFDPTMLGDSGDVWLDATTGSSTFDPLELNPGQTGTINMTITPNPGQVGQTVTGFIYIDTYNPDYLGSGEFTGDEVARIPYTYTVSP